MPATTNLDTASPATTKQAQLGKSNITATIVNGTRPFHNAHHGDLRLQLCNIQYTKDLHAATDDENCHSKWRPPRDIELTPIQRQHWAGSRRQNISKHSQTSVTPSSSDHTTLDKANQWALQGSVLQVLSSNSLQSLALPTAFQLNKAGTTVHNKQNQASFTCVKRSQTSTLTKTKVHNLLTSHSTVARCATPVPQCWHNVGDSSRAL